MVDLLWNPVGMLIVGVVLGVIFDEFLTTKFSWLKAKGREALKDLKAKL